MSFYSNQPAGTGLLLVDGNDAWLDAGATDLAYRLAAANARSLRAASATPSTQVAATS